MNGSSVSLRSTALPIIHTQKEKNND